MTDPMLIVGARAAPHINAGLDHAELGYSHGRRYTIEELHEGALTIGTLTRSVADAMSGETVGWEFT